MTRPRIKTQRKAREWTLCVDDGRFKSIYGPLRSIGEVWGDKKQRPHFKAPHAHVRVREVLPRKKKWKR